MKVICTIIVVATFDKVSSEWEEWDTWSEQVSTVSDRINRRKFPPRCIVCRFRGVATHKLELKLKNNQILLKSIHVQSFRCTCVYIKANCTTNRSTNIWQCFVRIGRWSNPSKLMCRKESVCLNFLNSDQSSNIEAFRIGRWSNQRNCAEKNQHTEIPARLTVFSRQVPWSCHTQLELKLKNSLTIQASIFKKSKTLKSDKENMSKPGKLRINSYILEMK